MIKVAQVNTWSEPFTDFRTGGLLSSINYISQDLAAHGIITDKYFFEWKGKVRKYHQQDFKALTPQDTEVLNGYDLVIFSTAGSAKDHKEENPMWRVHLNNLKVPFFVQIHDEDELKSLRYAKEFFEHPMCKLIMPITDGIGNAFGIDKFSVPSLTYPAYSVTNMPDPEAYRAKVDKVVTACRLTARKRVKELVLAAKDIHDAGFGLEINGAEASFFYCRDLKERSNEYWKFNGQFTDKAAVFSDAKFLWNATSLKKKTFYPRVEISSVEGAFYGCVLILNRETTPAYIDDSCAILIDPFNLNSEDPMRNLISRLIECKDKSIEMNNNFINAIKNELSKNITLLIEQINLVTGNTKCVA